MNSSAITNSIMPTVSIPGTPASNSAASGFGDVMASVTENWSERKSQIKHDAAKSAQSTWDENRADLNAKRSSEHNTDRDYSASDNRRDDEPVRADQDHRDDHAKVDDSKSDDNHDLDAGHTDDDGVHRDMEHADNSDSAPDDHAASDGDSKDVAQADDGNVAQDTAGDPSQTELGITDPNQSVQTVQSSVPLPGSPEEIALANAKSSIAQGSASNAAAAGQNSAGMAANATSAEATTDGLMSSTALSQPAAGASAKMAMNGADDAAGDELSSDKFLSRVIDSMSGDGKAKSDTSGISNASVNSQSSNAAGAQQATASNPAQTAQAAQQAMAAAGTQTIQNNPAAQTNTAAAGAVTATGGTEATTQAANGQLNTTSTLQQTNTGGQTAQTARHAPAQQVQQQVAVSIKNAASDGVDKISVQLRPEHLGRVDVKMEIGHDGRIQGVIQADTRETLDLLRQDSRALQQALKDAGLNADSQSFTFEHRDQGGQSQDGKGQSQMSANQGSSPEDGDVLSGAELAEHVGIGYGINPNGLVDIRI
ncbi:flagellar hook-length control protein FliK [Thalassospira lucentensis]|uniref:flagellar hook-length control protein FliK n=1 Tax=Thalassospira lucentensis TaxID=168935 RepID=UPI003D2ED963